LLFGMQLVAQVGFSQEDKFGADPEECKKNISLYREFRDQKNYKDAFGPWQKACELCPKAAKTLYTDGVNFYKDKIKNATDDAQKAEFAEAMFKVYDARIEHFGQRGYVLGRKGADMLRYKSDAPEEALAVLKESLDLQKEESEAGALGGYYTALYYTYKKGGATKADLLENYVRVSDYITHNLENGSDKHKKYFVKAQQNIDKAFVTVAECEDITPILEEKFAADPNNVGMLKMASKVLNARKCEEAPIYEKVIVKLNELEPSHESAFGLGKMMRLNGKFGSAIDYYKQALGLCPDCANIEQYRLGLADAYQANGQNAAAASMARQVLADNPNNGNAYLIIGNAISASSKGCGENEMEQRAVYWLAADYFAKAKAVDADVAALANNRIAAVKSRFPDKKLAFQYGFIGKEEIEIGCWINEKTRVRKF